MTRLPVVVEIPHAGLVLDAEALVSLVCSPESILRDADAYMDEVARPCADAGATVLVSHMSRYVVDLNRATTDVDAEACVTAVGPPNPHGVVWHRTTDGARALKAPLSELQFSERINRYHVPYHRTLEALIEETRTAFGRCVLLCAHSMPSWGRAANGEIIERPDVVPGTRGRTTATSELLSRIDETLVRSKLTFKHDDPYRGGYTTGRWGHPLDGISAVQLEVARRLYMSEKTLRIDPSGLARVQTLFARLVVVCGAP